MTYSKLSQASQTDFSTESFTKTLVETFMDPLRELKEFAVSLGGAHAASEDTVPGEEPSLSGAVSTLRAYSIWALDLLGAVANDSLVQMALAGGAGAYGTVSESFVTGIRAALATLGGVMGFGQLLRSSRFMGYFTKVCGIVKQAGDFVVKNFCRLLLVGVLIAAAYSGVKVIGKVCGLFFGSVNQPKLYSGGDAIKFLVELLSVGILSFCGIKVCGRHVGTVLSFMNLVDFKGELTKVYENLVGGIFSIVQKVVSYFTVEGEDSVIKAAIAKWNEERMKYTDAEFESSIDTLSRLCYSRVSRSAPYGTPTLSDDLRREIGALNVGDPRLTEVQKKRLVKLLTEANALVEENDWRCKVGVKRHPPVGVYFCGASNIGKSWGAQKFIAAFWKHFKAKAPRDFFPRYMFDFGDDDALFYTRNASQEYFEGLVSQPMIYYGEAFKNCQDDDKLTKDRVSRESDEMQALLDVIPYFPNYAALSTNREPGKGVAIAPIAVVAVSNYMSVPLGSDGYILGRRFDIAVLALWKRGHPKISKTCSHLCFYKKKSTLFTNVPGDEGVQNWQGKWTEKHQFPATEEEFDTWPWREDWEPIEPRDLVIQAGDAFFQRLADYRGVFNASQPSVFDAVNESVHEIELSKMVMDKEGNYYLDGEKFKKIARLMFIRESTGERWQLMGSKLVFITDDNSPKTYGADCKIKKKDFVEIATSDSDNDCFFDVLRLALDYQGSLKKFRKKLEARYMTDVAGYERGGPLTREHMHVLAQRMGLKLCLHCDDKTIQKTPVIPGPPIHVKLTNNHATWLKISHGDKAESFAIALAERLKMLQLDDAKLDCPQPSAFERYCLACEKQMEEPVELLCAHRVCRKCVVNRGSDRPAEERMQCPVCYLVFGDGDFVDNDSYRAFCTRHNYTPVVVLKDLHKTYVEETSVLETVDRLVGKDSLPRINQYKREQLYLFEECFSDYQREVLENFSKLPLPSVCRYQTLNSNVMDIDEQPKTYWKSSFVPPEVKGLGCGPFNLAEGCEPLLLHTIPTLERYGLEVALWLGAGDSLCHVYGPLRANVIMMMNRQSYVVYFCDQTLADLLGVEMDAIVPDKPPIWRAKPNRGLLDVGHGVISGRFCYVSEDRILDAFAQVHNMSLGQMLSLCGDEIPGSLAGTRLLALGDAPDKPFPEYDRSTLARYVADTVSTVGWIRETLRSRATWGEVAWAWVSGKLAALRDFFVNGWDSKLVALTAVNALVAALGVAVVKILVDYFGGGRDPPPSARSGIADLSTNKDSDLKIERVDVPQTDAFTFSLIGSRGDVSRVASEHGWKQVQHWDDLAGGLPMFVSEVDSPSTIQAVLKGTKVRMRNVEQFDAAKYASGFPMSLRACNFVPVRLVEDDEIKESVSGVVLRGGVVIFPGHVLVGARANSKLLVGNKYYGVSEVKRNPLGDNKDVALVTKSNDFQRGADEGFFAAGDAVRHAAGEGDACSALIWRNGMALLQSGRVFAQQQVTVHTARGDQLRLIGYVVRGIKVQPGDCGAVLVRNGQLMGFLSAAWPDSGADPVSFWTSLDRMSVKNLIDRYGDPEWPVSGVASSTYDGPGKKSDRVAFGESVANYPFHRTSPTHVVPNRREETELRDEIDPEHQWMPSDCSTLALERAFLKFPRKPVNALPIEIRAAVEWYKSLWQPSTKLRVIDSAKAAANGFLDSSMTYQILHPVDLSKSASCPWNDPACDFLGTNEKGERLWGIGDKRPLYPRRDANGNLEPASQLLEQTEQILNSWRRGISPRTVFGLSLKAEIRTQEAYNDHKCRLFIMPGHHVNLAGRMQVGHWIAEMKRHGRKLHHAVGVNCHSADDWTHLAEYIGRDGWRVICPDFSGYDTSHPSEMVMAVADVVASYYPEKEKKAIRACLLTFNRFEARLPPDGGRDASCASVTGLASGSQVTTNLNCVITCLLYMGAGIRFFGDRRACERQMRFVCYGDDALVAIAPNVDGPAFTKSMVEFMAECGYKLTDADKGDEIKIGTLDDAVFLKRRFLKTPIGTYLAPLPENQVLRPLCFYPENKERSDDVRQDLVRACLIEIAEQQDYWTTPKGRNVLRDLKEKMIKAVNTSAPWAAAFAAVDAENTITKFAELRRQPGTNFVFAPDGSVAVSPSGAALDPTAKCEWSY